MVMNYRILTSSSYHEKTYGALCPIFSTVHLISIVSPVDTLTVGCMDKSHIDRSGGGVSTTVKLFYKSDVYSK